MQCHQDFSDAPLDPVTGLFRLDANGPGLLTALAAARATHRQVALLHVDIDMFRSINADMGEAVGDHALAAVAQRLRKAMPHDGWLWRLNSDEFIAGIGYRPGELDGEALAEMLRDAFETPLWIPPYTLPVTLSIGIAVFPEHAGDAPSLLASAERALRDVKREGLNSIGLYSAMPDKAASNDGFAERFVEALDNRELQLF